MKLRQALMGLILLLPMLTVQAEQPVSHVVMVWFQEGTSAEHITAAAQQTEQLRKIAGVIDVRVGGALASDRSHVDDSFDLGILVSFDSESSMRAYVSDPIHKAYVKGYIADRVDKLLVYDF